MIDFQRHGITLEHLNVRVEKRGEEDHPMIDLKITADLPNTVLDRLCEGLRVSLYKPDAEGDLLGKDEQHMPVLRFPQLGPLHFSGEVKPVKMTIHTGARARDDLVLAGAKLGKITVRALEGGTFGYGFRLQIEPSNNEVSKLMQLLKHQVPATLDLSEAGIVAEANEDE